MSGICSYRYIYQVRKGNNYRLVVFIQQVVNNTCDGDVFTGFPCIEGQSAICQRVIGSTSGGCPCYSIVNGNSQPARSRKVHLQVSTANRFSSV